MVIFVEERVSPLRGRRVSLFGTAMTFPPTFPFVYGPEPDQFHPKRFKGMNSTRKNSISSLRLPFLEVWLPRFSLKSRLSFCRCYLKDEISYREE